MFRMLMMDNKGEPQVNKMRGWLRLSEKKGIWWLRQHQKVVKLYDLFKGYSKRQPKVNAIIRYIQVY